VLLARVVRERIGLERVDRRAPTEVADVELEYISET
jgi:hypothetical protein